MLLKREERDSEVDVDDYSPVNFIAADCLFLRIPNVGQVFC